MLVKLSDSADRAHRTDCVDRLDLPPSDRVEAHRTTARNPRPNDGGAFING